MRHVDCLAELRERDAEDDEHEYGVQAHGGEHLVRAHLVAQVLAQENLELRESGYLTGHGTFMHLLPLARSTRS